MKRDGFVYILSSGKRGTLYVGVTNELCRRVYEHKNHELLGFATNYGVNKLVYFEDCDDIYSAIDREKQLKNWRRQWKIELIEQHNPDWRDLYDTVCSI